MTGFVVAIGVGADAITTETLHRSRAPDAADAQIVFQAPGLIFVSTRDLPFRVTPETIVVGEVLAASPSSLAPGTLAAQRTAGLEQLLSVRSETGDAPDDFALEHHYIVWDRPEARLLAARDSLGVRPVYHHWDGETLLVGSAVRWLLTCGIPEQPDPQSLRRFIAGRPLDPDRTFVEGVRRLRPGQRLAFHRRGPPILRGEATLSPPQAGVRRTEADFRSQFEAAITGRLAASEETYALLSGGLDSSAIAVVAAASARRAGRRAPPTLSAVFDATPQWSERPFIEAVVSGAELDARLLDLSQAGPFDDFSARLDELGGLFPAPGLYIGRAMYREASDTGRRVILDGHGGDEVVSYGWDRFHELALGGRWRALLEELRAGHIPGEPSALGMWLLYWLKYGRLRRWVGRIVRFWRTARLWFPRSADAAGEGLLAAGSDGSALDRSDRTTKIDPASIPVGSRQHWAVVSDPDQSAAMEVLYGAASAVGVVLRFPFWDRRLVELCLALPADLKHRDGYTRWLMRAAAPELPDLVRWRRDKLDFTPHLAVGMIRTHEAYLRDLLDRPGGDPLWRVVRRDAARRLIRRLLRFRDRTDGRAVQAVWRIGALSLWFDALAARA